MCERESACVVCEPPCRWRDIPLVHVGTLQTREVEHADADGEEGGA